MARATGSYPVGHGFKSNSRYHGPLVKRLRHRPFTAVTGVRFSHGSPITKAHRNSGALLLLVTRGLQETRQRKHSLHCRSSHSPPRPSGSSLTRRRVWVYSRSARNSPTLKSPYGASQQQCAFVIANPWAPRDEAMRWLAVLFLSPSLTRSKIPFPALDKSIDFWYTDKDPDRCKESVKQGDFY